MTACVQSTAMSISEVWWKGGQIRGTISQANGFCSSWSTNRRVQPQAASGQPTWGALSMESGLRPAGAQLENRRRRLGLRLLSLLQGDQAREVAIGAPTAIGRRLMNALAYSGRIESTVLLEEPETLDAELLQEEEAEAKAEAEKVRLGLTVFTDGSRLDDGASGYSVIWKNGQSRMVIIDQDSHGLHQETYGAERAALARALETASRRQTPPQRVTIFTDAQAAIKRMAPEEPGPGQMYVLQTRKHIALLRSVRPDITIEIGWRPAHKGVPGNWKTNEWAKLAAEKQMPVGWNDYDTQTGWRHARCRCQDPSHT